MLAGTFNLVMAQRLGRKLCSHCQLDISVVDNPQYADAKECFVNYDKTALKKEIISRGISVDMRNKFIQKGVISK